MSDVIMLAVSNGKAEPLMCSELSAYQRDVWGVVRKCRHAIRKGNRTYCGKRMDRQPPKPCPYRSIITIDPKEKEEDHP
ncbi:MAG: hypothetical protein WC375_07080 [Methanomassiliicoccales archaeon]|jgi:hypothetical protein